MRDPDGWGSGRSCLSKGPLTCAFLKWALVVSNLGPPPCKGQANALVKGLSSTDRVPLSSVESLWVPLSRYADVMRGAASGSSGLAMAGHPFRTSRDVAQVEARPVSAPEAPLAFAGIPTTIPAPVGRVVDAHEVPPAVGVDRRDKH
jgi:hypothetical protein